MRAIVLLFRRPASPDRCFDTCWTHGDTASVRDCLDSRHRPRSPDAGRHGGRRDGRRLHHHDGGADAGLADRLPASARRHDAAHHDPGRTPLGAHAARGPRIWRGADVERRQPQQPPRHQISGNGDGVATFLDSRRRRAVRADLGDHRSRWRPHRGNADGHRSAARGACLEACDPDARGTDHRLVPRAKRHPDRRSAGAKARPQGGQFGGADRRQRDPGERDRWSESSVPD